jgi:hypothetical protein
MPITSSRLHPSICCAEPAAGPAQVRAHLDELIVQQPDLFERMALREIRRLRPRLHDTEALGIAYDAVLAVVGMAAHTPVALDTVLGLVRRYVRWAALDRLRLLPPGSEQVADPDDLQAHVTVRVAGGSLMEDLRAASQLQTLERIGTRMRALVPDALRDGRLRLSAEQVRSLRAAAASGSAGEQPSADAAARKRLERARTAIVAWVRTELADDAERRLMALLLGDGMPQRERLRKIGEVDQT